MTEPLEKRSWCYIQRPAAYEIAGCQCGNDDPDWSEFNGHLWCATCEKDFVPEHNGVFGGPIPVHTCAMLGMIFDRMDLATMQVLRFPDYTPEPAVDAQPAALPAPGSPPPV